MNGSSPSAPRADISSGVEPVVFIVDDDVSVRESIEALVRIGGWRAEAFESAQAFLARAIELRPS